MDPVSCLYNFLSIGILCYFVIICFLIKKCCMNCGTNCDTNNICKCFQKIYEGEITPSNHVIVCEGDQRLPISYILNQQDNEGEYILGDDGVLYRNEACKECCKENTSHSSCNSHEDVLILKSVPCEGDVCPPCSPSALGLGEGSLRKSPSAKSGASQVKPPSIAKADSFPATPEKSPLAPSLKGSPPLSVASELQGIISPGVEPILTASFPKAQTRSIPVVEFQAEPAQRIFTVEGSVGSSMDFEQMSGNVASITASRSNSNVSRTSCGSRTSRKSGASRTSAVSCGSRTSRTSTPRSRSPRSGGSPKSGVSPKSGSSPKIAISPKSGGSPKSGSTPKSSVSPKLSASPGRGVSSTSIFSKKSCLSTISDKLNKSLDKSTRGSPSLGTKSHSGTRSSPSYTSRGSPTVVSKTSKTGTHSSHSSASIKSRLSKICSSVRSSPTKSESSPCGISPIKSKTASSPEINSFGAKVSKISSSPSARISDKASPPEVRSVSTGSSRSGGFRRQLDDDIKLTCDGPISPKGERRSPSPCVSTEKERRACGTGSGKLVCAAREARKQSKSGSCIPPCRGAVGTGSAKTSKSGSFKNTTSGEATPRCVAKRGTTPRCATPKEGTPREATSKKATPKNTTPRTATPTGVCRKELACSSTKSNEASKASRSPVQKKSSYKFPCKICSLKKIKSKTKVERSPSPILKSPDENAQPTAKVVISPTRVSIKDIYDIITPEGITSAPTFGKECKPCPHSKKNASTETNANRRNIILADEYKDSTSNKRKADKISADYKDSTDNSRGSKNARFSLCTSNTCSRRSSSRGYPSWPSTPSTPAKSATNSTAVTSSKASEKCSKCSSKFSSVTDISSLTPETKPSGTSSCIPSCNKSGVSSKSKSTNNKTESCTTADIDDFRTLSAHNSRCENLGVALSKSTCGKIRRAIQEVTCEAIRDPSAEVTCNDGGPNDECSAIQILRENAECPSLLEYMNIVDKLSSGTVGATRTTSKTGNTQGSAACPPLSCDSTNQKESQQDVKDNKQAIVARPVSAPERSNPSTVNAAVIHEISTKVQSCLQHAREIAAKITAAGGTSECRKTMRVQAKSVGPRGAQQSIQCNSKLKLNTTGVQINEVNRINKQLGESSGIEVKIVNKQGNVESFKTPYKDLKSSQNGPINIRICSPCKNSPGKLLCVSTNAHPCCSESTNNITSSSADGSIRQQRSSPPRVKIQEETESESESTRNNTESQSSTDECPNPEVCRKKAKKNNKDTVVMYERSPTQGPKLFQKNTQCKADCGPSCANCKKKSCPGSKHHKGKKTKLQVYNVTTSHATETNRNIRASFVKGMPIIETRRYDQYTHPDRYRAGENYLKRRRELIKKIKVKCPWV